MKALFCPLGSRIIESFRLEFRIKRPLRSSPDVNVALPSLHFVLC